MARILVIEDDRDILMVLCYLLEREGYDVLGVESAERVPGYGVAVDPDFVLIDLMLPGVDGISLAARLRSDGYPTACMIAMSASNQMLARAEASGLFQATLAKPFDLDVVLDAVAACVSPALGPEGTDERRAVSR